MADARAGASPAALDFPEERTDLALAFRLAVRHGWHEAVANHFSLAVEDGRRFLINPNQRHFSRIRASDLLLLDPADPNVLDREEAPDPTAWGLHGAIHRDLPHARCALHLHPRFATVLASLADSTMPPIDQNTAVFFNRIAVDEEYGGFAFEEEAERCCRKLADPDTRVLLMGNHGVLVIGDSVAEAFNRLYYFERAAETLILALATGRPLRVLSDEVAERVAQQGNSFPEQGERHFREWQAILDSEGADYRE